MNKVFFYKSFFCCYNRRILEYSLIWWSKLILNFRIKIDLINEKQNFEIYFNNLEKKSSEISTSNTLMTNKYSFLKYRVIFLEFFKMQYKLNICTKNAWKVVHSLFMHILRWCRNYMHEKWWSTTVLATI